MTEPLDRIIDAVRELMELVSRPDTNTAWSPYKTSKEAAAELRRHLAALMIGDLSRVEELAGLFASTGPFQQIANDSGWEPHFMLLAAHVEASTDLLRESGGLPDRAGE